MSLRLVLLVTATTCLAVPAAAQDVPADPVRVPRDAGALIAPGDVLDFAADEVRYDDTASVVTAIGAVELSRDAWKLTADRVDYDRTRGRVIAQGHVISTDPEGNQAFGDRVDVTDSLSDGKIGNVLLVLNDGGRLAATEGVRAGDVFTLTRAAYSPCAVVDNLGCPHDPVWQVKAERIRYARERHRISYKNASLEMFGVPVVYLPSFSHPDSTAPQASGLLVPNVEIRRQLGFGVSLPYHFALARDRDLTITPHFYTGENPALEITGRRLLQDGPIEGQAFFTYANLTDFAADNVTAIDRGDQFRGYFALKGRLQHSPEWRSSFSLRLTTDDTFNRRYGLDYDDTLRSTYALERLTANSWLSIAAWGFQGLRATDQTGEIPFVLPLVDYDWRPADPVLGGRLRIAANSMNLVRIDGQSVQRGLAFGRWDRSFLTGFGQRITGTLLVRGDVYNVIDADKATLPEYAGRPGVQARGLAVAAIDAEWPFAGPAFGGSQTITPRVQIVAAPADVNRGIPNEDSRAIELEDVSIFDLSRFPGYDRFEGGSRITYGALYTLDRPGIALRSEIAQSVRIAGGGEDFPQGTGLSGTVSDFVGRTNLKIGSWLDITHRFRVDRASLAVRRNEFDIAVGTRRTYATVGYVKLNRNIALEDLEDRAELRLGGRVAFARFWSAFGSAIIDLTTQKDNPNTTGDGFDFVRHRLGVEYEDECFRIGLSWRQDYVSDRDFRAGSTYLFTIAFKTLGATR